MDGFIILRLCSAPRCSSWLNDGGTHDPRKWNSQIIQKLSSCRAFISPSLSNAECRLSCGGYGFCFHRRLLNGIDCFHRLDRLGCGYQSFLPCAVPHCPGCHWTLTKTCRPAVSTFAGRCFPLLFLQDECLPICRSNHLIRKLLVRDVSFLLLEPFLR